MPRSPERLTGEPGWEFPPGWPRGGEERSGEAAEHREGPAGGEAMPAGVGSPRGGGMWQPRSHHRTAGTEPSDSSCFRGGESKTPVYRHKSPPRCIFFFFSDAVISRGSTQQDVPGWRFSVGAAAAPALSPQGERERRHRAPATGANRPLGKVISISSSSSLPSSSSSSFVKKE